MNSLRLSAGCITNLSIFFILLCLVLRVRADEITIQGDTQILKGTEATFYVTLDRHYPTIFFFGYQFDINLSPPVNVEVLSNTLAKFSHFFDTNPGKYTMHVTVHIYFFQQKAWQVAEKTISIEVKDNLDDFFDVKGKQDGLPGFTPEYMYVPNRPVDFWADMVNTNSILAENSTKINYAWTLHRPNSSLTTFDDPKFEQNFTIVGQYKLELKISANITSYSKIMTGTKTRSFDVKSPITNASVTGNNFVKNGSLLHLNITCNGTSNFMICFYFTDSLSNKSCIDSAIVVTDCFLHISHYFPQNGTQYINIGVRNDVSEPPMLHSKITIYKVGPSPSLVFVILPLVSSFLVIVIILFGVAHHIRQRRKMNATIEVATMESFGLYGQTSLTEKTFVERIQDSLKSLFRSS